MRQTKFTPGDWTFMETEYDADFEGKVVGDLYSVCCVYSKQDGYLLGASKEMYNMLERILSAANEGEINWTILRDTKKLLEKARGEQTTQP